MKAATHTVGHGKAFRIDYKKRSRLQDSMYGVGHNFIEKKKKKNSISKVKSDR